MPARRARLLVAVLAVAGCAEPDAGPEAPAREAVNSEVILAAVDASSGEPLADRTMKVRYLVRVPVTLDATGAEEVPTAQAYSIEQPVSEDSLVVEVRVEAASYERLDTVLAVARGQTAGPFDVRLTPRPGRVASRPRPTEPRPTAATPPPRPPPAAPAFDRAGIEAGDRAFEAQDWRAAAQAYASVSPPASRTGNDARAYQLALVRRGMAHINLGEWQAAQSALRDAIGYDFAEYSAFFYLGQAECALGRYEAGRAMLDRIPARRDWGIPAEQRPVVLALVDYQQGICTYNEALATQNPTDRARISQRARGQLQGFVQTGLGFSPLPPELRAAVFDARRRIQQLR